MKFRCPHCQQKIDSGDKSTGEEGVCPSCHQAVRVPESLRADFARNFDVRAGKEHKSPWSLLLVPAVLIVICGGGAAIYLEKTVWFKGPPASKADRIPAASAALQQPLITVNSTPVAIPQPAAEINTPEPPPSPPAKETLPVSALAWLAAHEAHWPKQLRLNSPVEFPVLVNGKLAGSVQAPAGTAVTLVQIERENVVVAYNGALQRTLAANTDAEEVAMTEMAKPEPTPGAPSPTTAAAPTATQVSPSAMAKASPSPLDSWRKQFMSGLSPLGSTPTPSTPAKSSDITYTLNRAKEPTEEESAAYAKITAAMEKAIWYYDRYTSGLREHVTANYSPDTPTADANSNGNMRFGKYSNNQRVAMHELAHTLGVGTSREWGNLVVNGVFTGSHATRQLQEITKDPKAVLHADRMHFWPYGLNYDNEVHSDQDFINHCKMVSAIYQDLRGK